MNIDFLFQIKRFEKLETDEERWKVGKEIYDQFIMKELLSNSHVIHPPPPIVFLDNSFFF